MEKQNKIIQYLTEFFRRDINRIQGAILIGSFGRGQGSPESDIDIELLIEEEKLIVDEFTNDIIQLFNDTEDSLAIKHTLWLGDQRKLALYHGSQLLLTELYLYTQLSQFDKYFLGSRIIDLQKCILVDRKYIILQHLKYILALPYDNRRGLIRDLVASIRYQLESTSSARRRCDAYKFYFLSNIALHELVRLTYVLDDLSSTMNLDESEVHLEKLVKFFLQQLDRIENDEELMKIFNTVWHFIIFIYYNSTIQFHCDEQILKNNSFEKQKLFLMGNNAIVKAGTSKVLTSQDIALLKRQSRLSEQEIRNLHETFWNDFPTGRLDKKGFMKYYEDIKDDKDRTSILCDHVFAVFDKNHDGTIDFNEFLLAVSVGTPHDLDSHLDYVFEMCDVSGDGKVDINELATFLSASLTIVGKADENDNLGPRKLAADIFNTLGISEDKKLIKEEFIKGCKRAPHLRELFGGGK
ncbi:unnamed protein product [Rotaria magnacalcarata]